jgi:hypothetical protein
MAGVTAETAGGRGLPRLSWSAIIAGVALALAAHIMLGLIGAALGFAAEPSDSRGVGAAAAIWALITPFVATSAGAWLAVRLAREWDEAGSNVHGVIVWALGLIAGALFLTGTMATGAMTAGTAASGNAGTVQRMTGVTPRDTQTPQAERAQDQAAKGAAAAAGGAAMAALAGLLGAFAGAGLARPRREGQGMPFRIAIQRRAHANGGEARATHAPQTSTSYQERTYAPPPTRTEETTREVTRTEGPGAPADPYHH